MLGLRWASGSIDIKVRLSVCLCIHLSVCESDYLLVAPCTKRNAFSTQYHYYNGLVNTKIQEKVFLNKSTFKDEV